MGELFPFRFAAIGDRYLVSTDSGDFFLTSPEILRQLVEGNPNPENLHFLKEVGFAYEREGDFHWNSFVRRLRRRKDIPLTLQYIIAIPTLRCDLKCSYCQVARADRSASGYDWSENDLGRFLNFLDQSTCDPLKIEFQGGEPSLRLDIVSAVVNYCRNTKRDATFVLCTNLNNLSPGLLKMLEDPKFSISTSLDGPQSVHKTNRTESDEATDRFLRNLEFVRARYGGEKISALPTITSLQNEHLEKVIDTYAKHGFSSIYLRPVNYHGFARKSFPGSRDAAEAWCNVYRRAVRYIFERNTRDGRMMREYGLELALRRIFTPSSNGHVDFRSPNPVAVDYLVVDHDGRFYPSDEARMLSRTGVSDLSIGNLTTGIDQDRASAMSWNQMNEVHEDCIHCAYQTYCGIDNVDDISRYGRIDLPKHMTWFCRVNEDMFDMIFELLRTAKSEDIKNLSLHLTGKFDLTPFAGRYIYD